MSKSVYLPTLIFKYNRMTTNQLTVPRLFKKLAVFYRTRIFIAVFTKTCQIIIIIIIIIITTAIELSPGGSGYFTRIQNMKLVTNKFKSGGQHEKHVIATWNLGNHLSICF